jgi:hypothetical protein
MSRRTVGSSEEKDAILELKDAEDSLYAAANALLRVNERDPLGDACGALAKAAGRLLLGIEERKKKR